MDGQELKPVSNITIITQEDYNKAHNFPIYRTTVEGNFSLSNLSNGLHNVTVYDVITTDFSLGLTHYEKGEPICSANYSFEVELTLISTPISTINIDSAPFDLITPLIIAFIIIGATAFGFLLFYRRHRKTANPSRVFLVNNHTHTTRYSNCTGDSQKETEKEYLILK